MQSKAQYVRQYYPPGQVPIKQWSSDQPKRDLHEFMRMYGYVGATDFKRRCSERTYTSRRVTLWATFSLVKERIRGITSLSQFTPRYIPLILEIWGERTEGGQMRLSIDTQVQNFSVLSWFWRLHGVSVRPIKEYIEDPQLRLTFQRSSVATRDKSWSGNGVDVESIIELARREDPVVARLLEGGRDFGLRLNESLRLQPHDDDKGDHLALVRGTKTGRPRDIHYANFGEEALKQAIDGLKDQLEPGQHAAWQGRTLVQARSHLYYVLRKIGVTKKQLGVTFHGLRAQWAIDQFQRLTGAVVPVRGGTAVDYRRFSDQRRLISEALGHNRIRVTAAYYGSFFRMKAPGERRFRESWQVLEPLLPRLHAALEARGLKNMWWVGSRSNGSNANLGELWEFMIDDTVDSETVRLLACDLEPLFNHELGIVYLHSSHTAPAAARSAWVESALPLFAVEAPVFTRPLE